MDQPGTSTMNDQELCQLCKTSGRRYTCPRCEISYCSLECYKSNAHLECSESFYKECVETEMKTQDQDPESRQRMIDILKRIQSDDIELEDDLYDDCEDPICDENFQETLDSDDEDIPDLEERLKSINLDDADQLWSVLTDTEKQQFEAIMRTGEATDLLPTWTPWWSYKMDKKIVEIDEKNEPEYVAKCPTLVSVPNFNELTKASPNVRFNLLNVLYAYVYTVLHYNGDHQNSPKEAVTNFLQLSENMSDNEVYSDSPSACNAVFQKIINCLWLAEDEEAIRATEEAVISIINGPETTNSDFYLLAALSDLHQLFANAKHKLSSDNKQTSNKAFSRKFNIGEIPSNVTKKKISLCIKKIEYYLSWVKKYGLSVEE